jgi:hypothetical protein
MALERKEADRDDQVKSLVQARQELNHVGY